MSGPWPQLVWGQMRSQPLRALVTLLTLAFGVALFTAIHLVNGAALGEFEQAARRLAGEADMVVRAPGSSVPESLYANLAQRPEILDASPVLEVDAAVAGEREPLTVLGLDTFRAARLQPQLVGDIAGDYLGLFGANAIWLSETAARELGVRRGGRLNVLAGDSDQELVVRGILPATRYAGRLGVMDIASAQWTLDRVSVLSRIELRLAPGVDVDTFRARLTRELPAGLQISTPELEAARAASLTRAYRVNLAMLALVSILTGALLLFATQSLSVLRRRTSLALLRALGMTRSALRTTLLVEGLALGALGSLLGIGLGYVLALALLAAFRGSLGLDSPGSSATALVPQPLPLLGFFMLGVVAAGLGAWLPAAEAARRAPARALKAGDAELAAGSVRTAPLACTLLAGGGLLAVLPPLAGLPVFGYASIAALLGGGLLLVPVVIARVLALAPASSRPTFDIGLAQLRGSVAQLAVSLAAVIVSFSLMVAMAIMVHSFRESFDRWLDVALPADLRLRVAGAANPLDEAQQRALAGIDGIARLQLRRQRQVLLRDAREPVTLIAQDGMDSELSGERPGGLALVATTALPPGAPPPAWISEALADARGLSPGARLLLPLATGLREQEFLVAGVFRDYGRSEGAVFVERDVYTRASGDATATEAIMWLAPGADPAEVEQRIRGVLGDRGALEIRRSTEVREFAMRAFDRAFAVTYALEAVAVLIGLVGIACAGAANALARRAEFGVLRHLGMRRRQVVAMLAAEGFIVSAFAALYGLVLGGTISVVLVHVINRQSFHWSIDLTLPVVELAAFAAVLLAAATVTNVVSAGSALGTSALRAVREDW